jgi:hypothetical protein
MRKRDKIHVGGEQKQFNRHQDDDEILAIQKYTHNADRKQKRANNKIM